MKITTGRRTALILAIGFLACFAGRSYASPAALDKPYKQDAIAQAGRNPLPATNNSGNIQPSPHNQAVAADTLNEVDRALPEQAQPTQPAPAATVASKDPPAQRIAQTAASNGHSFWDETSSIGKIFIAVGALLTIASAARMFMA
jgi:hypothetical protein